LKRQVFSFTQEGKSSSELKYWNYSVVLRKDRRLALFSAVNVDANQRPQNAGRDGDRWYSDPRVGTDFEIGAEFYAEQRTFEIDRSANPFDRGHLTRRLDAQWGPNEMLAKRNGDDSFHWTNCSPQHWQLNQGKKRWLGLEEYVIQTFSQETGRACVINGPVFDAPLSKERSDGQMPNIAGRSHPDPTFGGVAIPKLFFKVVSCQGENRQLRVAAFLMSQEDLLRTIDRLKGMPPLPEEILTPAEARLYQVNLTDLERVTGLDFGHLRDAEVLVTEGARARTPRMIGDFEDVRM
jgi:endonuclease G